MVVNDGVPTSAIPPLGPMIVNYEICRSKAQLKIGVKAEDSVWLDEWFPAPPKQSCRFHFISFLLFSFLFFSLFYLCILY